MPISRGSAIDRGRDYGRPPAPLTRPTSPEVRCGSMTTQLCRSTGFLRVPMTAYPPLATHMRMVYSNAHGAAHGVGRGTNAPNHLVSSDAAKRRRHDCARYEAEARRLSLIRAPDRARRPDPCNPDGPAQRSQHQLRPQRFRRQEQSMPVVSSSLVCPFLTAQCDSLGVYPYRRPRRGPRVTLE